QCRPAAGEYSVPPICYHLQQRGSVLPYPRLFLASTREDAMPARLLPTNASVEGILDEYIYTLVRLRADALAAPLLPRFEAFFDDWKQIRDQEIELRIQRASGEAGIGLCDDGLDLLVDTVSHTLPLLNNDDRASALYL